MRNLKIDDKDRKKASFAAVLDVEGRGNQHQEIARHQSERGARLVVVAGLVWLGPRLIVQRRACDGRHGAGRLELPGGKLELGESPTVGLRRELGEEWGTAAAELRIGAVVDVLHHVYPAPGPEILLIVLSVRAPARQGRTWVQKIVTEPGAKIETYLPYELPIEQFLAADQPFIRGVMTGAPSAHLEGVP